MPMNESGDVLAPETDSLAHSNAREFPIAPEEEDVRERAMQEVGDGFCA